MGAWLRLSTIRNPIKAAPLTTNSRMIHGVE
jgi:hypothetical protein